MLRFCAIYYKQMLVQLLVNETCQLYSKAKLQRMQFSLISTMFTFSHMIVCNAVVLDVLRGCLKSIYVPKLLF